MQPPEEFDEALTDYVLRELGYELKVERAGIRYYADQHNVRPLIFDFSRGSVPIADFVLALENDGVNLETFYVALEAI